MMQEEAETCASWWRKTLRPKRVRFLAIDPSIVDCVCLPLNNLTFLPLCPSLRVFVKKKETKSAMNGFRFCLDMSQRSAAQHCHIDTPFCTIRKSHVTWNFAVAVPHSEEIRRCILLFLGTLAAGYSEGREHECGTSLMFQNFNGLGKAVWAPPLAMGRKFPCLSLARSVGLRTIVSTCKECTVGWSPVIQVKTSDDEEEFQSTRSSPRRLG